MNAEQLHDQRMVKYTTLAAIGVVLVFGAWLAFDVTRPKVSIQPKMAEWEVKAWRAIKCDHCRRSMDPFNKNDGFYPGDLNGRKKVLCEKCGKEWMAMIERAKKKGVKHSAS